jgi:hypothetical protein
MPFALLPLAVALRRLPVTTLALAGITCFQAVVMTATGPLAAYDWQWLSRAVDRLFVQTAASFVGVTGWYTITAFFLAAAAAVVLALASLPPVRATATDAVAAVGAVAAWAVWAHATYNDWGRTPDTRYVLAVLAAAAVVSLAWFVRDRTRPRAQVAT